MKLLHEDAPKEALDFLYVWIYGLWFLIVLKDPLIDLSFLPVEFFHPTGIWFRLLPESFHGFILSGTVLISLKVFLLVGLFFVIVNKHRKWMSVLSCTLLCVYQGLIRSFGHVNHPEIAILLSAIVLAIFTFAEDERSSYPGNFYAIPFITILFLFSLSYSFAGIHRIVQSGVGIFTSDSLAYWTVENARRTREFSINLDSFVLQNPWVYKLLKFGFPVVTLAEIMAPFCIISRRIRYVFLAVIVPFHIMVFLFLEIFFWQNLMLYVLFFDVMTWFAPKIQNRQPIIFFDGLCNLCNGFVDWIFKVDGPAYYHVASLQGETARELGLASTKGEDPGSVILVDEDGTFDRSDAVLKVFSNLGGLWKFAVIFYVVPKKIRDTIYGFVARNRYKVFGKRSSCRLPLPDEASRFLP